MPGTSLQGVGSPLAPALPTSACPAASQSTRALLSRNQRLLPEDRPRWKCDKFLGEKENRTGQHRGPL